MFRRVFWSFFEFVYVFVDLVLETDIRFFWGGFWNGGSFLGIKWLFSFKEVGLVFCVFFRYVFFREAGYVCIFVGRLFVFVVFILGCVIIDLW